MASIPDLLVDPYLVCLPPYCDEADVLDQFVENLLTWSDLLRRQDLAVHFPAICVEALLKEGYPFDHELRKMAARIKADHLSSDLVCKIAQDVLERTPHLEEICKINFVDFEESTCKVNPEVYISRLSDDIGWGFKHALVVLACLQQADNEAKIFQIVSAKSSPEEAFASQQLQIAAHVSAIDCFDAGTSLAKVVPLDIDHAFPVAFSGRSLLRHIGCLKLWAQAKSPIDVGDAINAQVEELLTAGAGHKREATKFYVSKHFLELARRNGFADRLNVADSCARILVGEPKHSVEPFRVSEDSSSAQRTRPDGARAFRTHLTSDGPGYRLMFWILKDESIEFANVGPKRELVIL